MMVDGDIAEPSAVPRHLDSQPVVVCGVGNWPDRIGEIDATRHLRASLGRRNPLPRVAIRTARSANNRRRLEHDGDAPVARSTVRAVIAERASPERDIGGLSDKAAVNLGAIPAAPELPAGSGQLIEQPLRILTGLAWKNGADHRHYFRIEQKRADDRRDPISIDEGVAVGERENVTLAFVECPSARRVESRPRLTHVSNTLALGLEPPLSVAGCGTAVHD